ALLGTTCDNAARASGDRLFRIRDILSSLTSNAINAMLNSSILAQGKGITAGSSMTRLFILIFAVNLSEAVSGITNSAGSKPTDVNLMVSPTWATKEKKPSLLAACTWLL